MKTSGSGKYLGGGCDASHDVTPAGVPHAGHGAFPPTGRVRRVQRRFVDTGERVTEGGGKGLGALARRLLWRDGGGVVQGCAGYDLRCGMDTLVDGKRRCFRLPAPLRG